MRELTAEEARQLLEYDPETGTLRWKPRPSSMFNGEHAAAMCALWNSRYAGKEAGCVTEVKPGQRYRMVTLFRKHYYAHRLALLIVNGEWPPDLVDHRDGDGLHNAFANLRPATPLQNAANQRRRSNNASGFKGVVRLKNNKFAAKIKSRGKLHYLGLFPTGELAHAAYVEAAERLHGEFASAG